MNLLLDTHILLWWLNNDLKLSDIFKAEIINGNNNIYLSSASLWEIQIKSQNNKLSVPDNIFEIIREEEFTELPINFSHVSKINELPLHHQDPFDRIMIAQCIVEKLTFLSVDSKIKMYEVNIFG